MSFLFILLCLAGGVGLVYALKGKGGERSGTDNPTNGGADPWRSDSADQAKSSDSTPGDGPDAGSGNSD
jgi:hypothetical protein